MSITDNKDSTYVCLVETLDKDTLTVQFYAHSKDIGKEIKKDSTYFLNAITNNAIVGLRISNQPDKTLIILRYTEMFYVNWLRLKTFYEQ